jgi:hypothetical protein
MMNLYYENLFEWIGKLSKFSKGLETEFKDKEKQFVTEFIKAEILVKMKDGTQKKLAFLLQRENSNDFPKKKKCAIVNTYFDGNAEKEE